MLFKKTGQYQFQAGHICAVELISESKVQVYTAGGVIFALEDDAKSDFLAEWGKLAKLIDVLQVNQQLNQQLQANLEQVLQAQQQLDAQKAQRILLPQIRTR